MKNKNISTTEKEIQPSAIVYSKVSLTCKIDKLKGLNIYKKRNTKIPTLKDVLSL